MSEYVKYEPQSKWRYSLRPDTSCSWKCSYLVTEDRDGDKSTYSFDSSSEASAFQCKMRKVEEMRHHYGEGHLKKFSFENIELLSLMSAIVEGHVEYYKEDFYDYDVETLNKAKISRTGSSYIWLVRRSGTWLLPEREIFKKGSPIYDHLRYYVETEPDEVIAAFEVKVMNPAEDGMLGDICTVDLDQFYRAVKDLGQEIEQISYQYENGAISYPVGRPLVACVNPHPEYGKFLFFDYLVKDESILDRIMSLGWMRLVKA